MKNNNEGIEKEEKTEWMDVGFQGIIFEIPKEYNHQLMKEAEILMKQSYNSGEKSKEKEMLDKFEKVIDELKTRNIEDKGLDVETEEYWVNAEELKQKLKGNSNEN